MKAWNIETEDAEAALQKWADLGLSMSAMMRKDSPEQKQALIEAIDFFDEIWLDWESKKVSKQEAKDYVINYRKE